MKRLAWQARRMLDAAGWWGALGIALLACSAAFAAAVMPARLAGLDAARVRLETLRAQMLIAGPATGGQGASRDARLNDFYAFFPPVGTLPDWLERIYAAAEHNGVHLDTGEYRLLEERSWKLVRYQVTLPVKGDYAQMRGFMADVLTAVPAAALEEIGFRREAVDNTVLDAQIRFTLYMGRA